MAKLRFMIKPSLREEKKLWRKGYKTVVCLDEAGRGPLAGPVTAAAVMIKISKSNLKSKILNLKSNLKGIKDSKKLSPKKRDEFYKILTKHPAIEWGIGIVSEKIIDRINIKNAAELAMEKALRNLNCKLQIANWGTEFLIIDGLNLKNNFLKKIRHRMIVKADEKVFSCAAASIIAKVTRDRIMRKLHKKYPQYRFDIHKGYCTKLHLARLQKFGSSPIHRKSFSPVLACNLNPKS